MKYVVEAWTAGWSISRTTPPPVEVPEGYRIDVGLPGHLVRYVLPSYDEQAIRTLAARAQPGTWLKLCAEPAVLVEVLGAGWRIEPPEFLMSTRLSAEPPAVAPQYRLEVSAAGNTVDALLTAEGDPAARGRAALAGEFAVIDQVQTEPDHRRKGLGTTIMRALSVAASQRGATTGVLVATDAGRALYSRLGWTLRSPVTAAVSRG